VKRVAALYVDPRGCYAGLEGVQVWAAPRQLTLWSGGTDARSYEGPHPIVAHPPCNRWCRLAGLVEARWGHRRGQDGGCFGSALRALFRFGGVLEHPAFSAAWRYFGLVYPPRGGGWVPAGAVRGLWTCHVEQGRYGHRAKKATWLLAYRCHRFELQWGSEPDAKSEALVSWCGNRVSSGENRPRLSREAASATPNRFRDVLIAMARTVE